MARHQHLGAVLGPPDERDQEMLAVPHRNDDRRIAREPLVDAFRLQSEPRGLPYQTKVFGCQEPDRLLERLRTRNTPYPGHQPAPARNQRCLLRSVAGSSSRCTCTMK